MVGIEAQPQGDAAEQLAGQTHHLVVICQHLALAVFPAFGPGIGTEERQVGVRLLRPQVVGLLEVDIDPGIQVLRRQRDIAAQGAAAALDMQGLLDRVRQREEFRSAVPCRSASEMPWFLIYMKPTSRNAAWICRAGVIGSLPSSSGPISTTGISAGAAASTGAAPSATGTCPVAFFCVVSVISTWFGSFMRPSWRSWLPTAAGRSSSRPARRRCRARR